MQLQISIPQKLEYTFQNIVRNWGRVAREDLGQTHPNDIPIENDMYQRTDMCTLWSIIHHLFLSILRCYNHPLPAE